MGFLDRSGFESDEDATFIAWIYVSLLRALVTTLAVGLASLRFAVLITRVPPRLMLVIVAVFCVIGAFAIRNDMNDVYVMAAFGLLGWVFHLLNLPATPLAFGLILGPILEENLRRSLMISQGDWTVFLDRPVAFGFLTLSVMILLAGLRR